jgi:N-acetylglutamate synthase-like GNAT family acetyltransferase
MKVRVATIEDLRYIESLRRSVSEDIGFIPLQRYEMEIDGRRNGRVLVVTDNGDLTGFCYATFGGQSAKVQQVAIQEDARRMERATLLVDAVYNEGLQRGLQQVSCRCAEDIPANEFWRSLGFGCVGQVDSKSVYAGTGREKWSKRGRRLNVYVYSPAGLWLPGSLGEHSLRQKNADYPRTMSNTGSSKMP